MLYAITTKYLPATTHRPSRIKAFTHNGHSLIMSYHEAENKNTGGDIVRTHEVVARALMDKFSWKGELVCGALEYGYSFVMLRSY